MSVYIGNAFSCSMLGSNVDNAVVNRATVDEVKELIKGGFTSCIGHDDTASVISNILGATVPMNRISVTLTEDDVLFVAQYVGPRLPEGATKLPEGAKIEWFRVDVFGSWAIVIDGEPEIDNETRSPKIYKKKEQAEFWVEHIKEVYKDKRIEIVRV